MLLLLVAAFAFHGWQLLGATSIKWDAVDVHYASQAYFSDNVRQGRLPFWTPYVFSGFPFLADLQVGAWYPLNWPFFLAGITPRSIQAELALHTAIAAIGTYTLAFQLLGHAPASAAAGAFFALSGWFAAHSEHVGMYQTAAWLPWLLVAVQAVGRRCSPRRLALAGIVGGLVVLPGHFQTALYACTTVAVFGCWIAWRERQNHRRLAAGLIAVATGALGLSAVQTLPGIELVLESVRTEVDAPRQQAGFLQPGALLTLVWPNFYGALFGEYTGPSDISQHYWYSGILLAPLAIVGALTWHARGVAAVLILPFAWYVLGPLGGLYILVAQLPGFRNIGAPINGWFIPTLGLALLAGAGFVIALRRLGLDARAASVLIVLMADLVFWNGLINRLAFDRVAAEQLHLAPLARFDQQVALLGTEQARLYGPLLTRPGYLNATLQAEVESTFGYNPLQLQRYRTYLNAAERNLPLIDGLAATHVVVFDTAGGIGALEHRPGALPLAFVPRQVLAVNDHAIELELLYAVDPRQTTLVSGAVAPPLGAGTVSVVDRGLDRLVLRYEADGASLVRLAVPWFPGWRATLAGEALDLIRVDHALTGIVVPAGTGDVVFEYRSNLFGLGATVSALSVLLVVLGLLWPQKSNIASWRG